MKSIFKLWVVAVIIISVALTGCSNSKKAPGDDRDKVVAEVNGEKILKGELLDTYNSERQNYGITTENENAEENKETVTTLKKGILDDMVYNKLISQKAKEAGFVVNDALIAEAKQEFDKVLVNIADQMKAQDSQSGQANTANVDYAKKAQDYVAEQLKSMGKTQDEYIKMAADQMNTIKFSDKVVGEIQVSDADIKSYYDNELKSQKGGSEAQAVVLYNGPEVTVKHILIQLPEADQKGYSDLVSAGKPDEAKKYLDEKLKGIYPKAKEVLDKVKKGENFESLIDKYGDDPGMKDNAEGYTVKHDGQFIPEFESAAFALKKGQVSGLVAGPYGYHIIKSYKVTPEKVFTLSEKKDEIKQAVTSQKKGEKWNTIVEDWMKNAAVKKYEDVL